MSLLGTIKGDTLSDHDASNGNPSLTWGKASRVKSEIDGSRKRGLESGHGRESSEVVEGRR